jgi:SHS2 domain-containing protein
MAADAHGAPAAGHLIRPHTADLALEAWAPGREECLSQAVRALAESYTTAASSTATGAVTVDVEYATDADLLVAVLAEAIFLAEVRSEIAVGASAEAGSPDVPGRAAITLATVPADAVEVIGAVPKAVSLHELEFSSESGRWQCHVTIDV